MLFVARPASAIHIDRQCFLASSKPSRCVRFLAGVDCAGGYTSSAGHILFWAMECRYVVSCLTEASKLIPFLLVGRNTQNFSNTYQILNRLVVQIGHNLPSLHSSKSPSVFFVHAQVFAATIKLNEVAASSEFRARRDCVVAAHTMIHWAFSLLKDSTCTNPITGVSIMLSSRSIF